jgi:hypothetical protein
MSAVNPLPPVPGTPFRALDFTAHQGTWEGGLHEVRWGYEKGWLRSQVRRALIRRRWFQVTLATPSHQVVLWIRDEGTTGTARVFVTDTHKKTGGVIGHRTAKGVPLQTLSVGPYACDGTDAWLRTDHANVSLTRPSPGGWSLEARWPELELNAVLSDAGAPPASTVIGEHDRRRPGLTSKWVNLAVMGRLQIGDVSLDLSEATGAITYTNGFFPAGARWLELTGFGTVTDGDRTHRIGVAFSDGNRHGDVHEHVLWVDDEVYAAPRVRLLIGGNVSRDAWRVRSAHGDLELKFHPRGGDVDTAKRLYGSSRTERVSGVLTGRIPLPDGTELKVTDLPAIAEDHRPM